jgi:rod shape-determining protein MreB and related proteins
MFGTLFSHAGGLLYVQIWKNRIRITDADGRKSIEDTPLIAVQTGPKGETVAAVGTRARGLRSPAVREINPFDHPRVALHDFAAAEKLLRVLFERVRTGGPSLVARRAVMHPMERFEGGLADIEKQALKELALSAGAREAVVYEGKELSAGTIDFESLKRNGA